jgi:spermidine synthase
MTATDAAPAATAPRRVAVLYAIFFVSGFCGLIYESIWSHYLKLLLGHASYAQAVVLVVFVGGLALGAWLTGRVSERIRQPILVYAAVEAAVAVMAFGFHDVFEWVAAWASSVFLPQMCGEPGSCAATWLLAGGLILPASILLGTTFPLMSAGVIRLGVRPGRGLSLLYFLNSAGAALGVLGSGFFLIPALGLPGTILLAGSMNAAVAIAAFVCMNFRPAATPPAAQVRTAASATPSLGAGLAPLLLVAAVTGLSSFIYEVAWIRMLTLVLGAATHSFELMLAPFILGLALGAWWIRDRIEDAREPLKLLAWIQVIMGLLAVATLPLYAATYDGMAFALRALGRSDESYQLFNLASGIMAAAVMLPATICAGMTLPLITALLLRQGFGERQVGQVYGINTFGAIAGVLVAVHLLIPVIGLKWTLAAAAAIDVILGVGLLALALERVPRPRPRGPVIALAAAAVGAAVLLVAIPSLSPLDPSRMASGVFRHGQARVDETQRKILFHQDGRTATISVVQAPNGTRSLLTNGKSEGATHPQRGQRPSSDDHTMVLLGALGPLHHPKARTAAVIGLGTGSTSAVLLESPAITQLDTIEIEPLMVDAAQYFRPRNDRVFTDPRSRMVIDDARAHFAKVRARYDLVVSEPSNPWVSGVAGLFTTEFYEHVAAHLAPDGHFVQWLHLYEASPELVASILGAFTSVFPEFKAYATNDVDVVLVARRDGRPPTIDSQTLDAMPGMRERLVELGITSADILRSHDAGRANAIQLLAHSYFVQPNSDFYPHVDQFAARDRFRMRTATSLFSLRDAPVPILDFSRDGAPDYAGKVTIATTAMPAAVRNRASSWHGHRYLRGAALTPEERGYLGSYTGDYALVRAWTSDCRFPAHTSAPWNAMSRVAADLNPGLNAKDAEAYWLSVANGKCRSALTPVQARWIELFAAVGARHPDRARIHAEYILANDQGLEPETRAYAALAAVAGNMAMGRRTEAKALLTHQQAMLPHAFNERAWFRYLRMALSAVPSKTAKAAAP